MVTWDVPLTDTGLIHPGAFTILKAVGQAVEATRSQPDLPPPQVVRPAVAILEVPGTGGGIRTDGRVRVTLKNQWPERIRGQVALAVEPAATATFPGGGRIDYDLEPGAESRTELPFHLCEPTPADTLDRIVLTRDGDRRHLVYRLPRREKIRLPQFDGRPALEELGGVLATVPSRTIFTEEGRALADLKFAIAAEHLALFCRVGDPAMRQAVPEVWNGSCLELFGIAEPGDPVNQLFLVPATTGGSAKALRLIPATAHSKTMIVPAAEIKFASWAVPGGYTAAALIPLAWWFQRPAAPARFYFEIAVSAGLDAVTFGRAAMFGTLNASFCSESYAEATPVPASTSFPAADV